MLLPALLGMAAGERLRSRLSATAFKRVLMGSLLALGLTCCSTSSGETAVPPWHGMSAKKRA
jgi:uncharacterized membrane protein YfcA